MFHTPPIKPSFTDESTTESYSDPLRARSYTLQSEAPSIEIDPDQDELPQELPSQLDELIDTFLKDLRAPKYSKPLTPSQLSATFQEFYQSFHSKTETFVKGSVYYKKRVSKIEMLTADEINEQRNFTRRIEFKIRRYIEIAEEKICVELFDKLFNKFPQDVKINNYLKDKIKIIQKIKGIKYDLLLDVENIKLNENSIEILEISQQFKELKNFKTPYSKLKVLRKVHSLINQFIKNQISNEFVDGDYFLPLLIYLILINKDDLNFYSNFIYIKRFRQMNLLIEESLYCLTNFEAAITFIQHLELTSEDGFDYSELNSEELKFLETKPQLDYDHESNIDLLIPSDGHILSNSTDGIKMISSAIDSSFKSMIHRFGSSNSTTQVTPANTPATPAITPAITTTDGSNKTTETPNVSTEIEDTTTSTEGYNPINKLVGAMRWRSNTSTPQLQSHTQSQSQSQSQPQPQSQFQRKRSSTTKSIENFFNKTKSNNEIPIDLNKFQNKNFKDMTITELEEMFNDYTMITKLLDTKETK